CGAAPLVEGIRGHDAAPTAEGGPEGPGTLDGLGARVDQARGLAGALRVVRHQPPAEGVQLSLAVVLDDGGHLIGGGDVEAAALELRNAAGAEDARQLVGRSGLRESAAHRSILAECRMVDTRLAVAREDEPAWRRASASSPAGETCRASTRSSRAWSIGPPRWTSRCLASGAAGRASPTCAPARIRIPTTSDHWTADRHGQSTAPAAPSCTPRAPTRAR